MSTLGNRLNGYSWDGLPLEQGRSRLARTREVQTMGRPRKVRGTEDLSPFELGVIGLAWMGLTDLDQIAGHFRRRTAEDVEAVFESDDVVIRHSLTYGLKPYYVGELAKAIRCPVCHLMVTAAPCFNCWVKRPQLFELVKTGTPSKDQGGACRDDRWDHLTPRQQAGLSKTIWGN